MRVWNGIGKIIVSPWRISRATDTKNENFLTCFSTGATRHPYSLFLVARSVLLFGILGVAICRPSCTDEESVLLHSQYSL
jgi:hypothetical protein